jgi:hypothetical protein
MSSRRVRGEVNVYECFGTRYESSVKCTFTLIREFESSYANRRRTSRATRVSVKRTFTLI